MNKLLLTLAALASTAAASAQTIYSADFMQKDCEAEFNKWTVIDANKDSATWRYDADGSHGYVDYPYSAVNRADDWFISPQITPTTAGKLMVKYTTWGTSMGESMEVLTGDKPTVEALTNLYNTHDKILGEATTNYFFYDAVAGEPFYVGFHCTSPADHWKFYMMNFSVFYINKVVDLKADSVLSPVRGFNLSNAEEVKVRIVNEGEETSDAFEVSYQVDSSEVVTETVNETLAPGASMIYTFKTKADLSTPRHNYKIKVWPTEANDVNHDNDSFVATVRCDGALNPPCFWGFETKEDNAQLISYDVNEDGSDFAIHTDPWFNFARTGVSCLAYFYNKTNDANDWFMLDPVNVEAGNYVLRYWYSATDGHPEKFGVYWGNGNKPSDMTNLIEDCEATQGAYQESFKVIKFDKPQTIYLGFYCHSDKDENVLSIDDVQFYKASSDNVDIVPNNLAKPFDFVRTPNDKDVVFDVSNVGIKDADCKVTILVDSVEKYAQTVSLTAQEIKTITAADVISSLASGKHSLQIITTCALDTIASNDTISKQFVVLGTPMKLYNFEDSTLADLTFYVGDEGTINAEAGEEFNAEGWGIFNLENHAMYGEHVLAGTSWIDGATPDRWAILPQVKVTGDNAYFAWDANSFNQSLLESYNVKVSDGSGNPADWWYSTEQKVEGESITPKTRGIDLSKYKDKEIYIGFNLITKKGEVLILDNLGLYGDVEFTGNKFSGIEDVNNDADGMVIFDQAKFAAVGAKTVSIVDMMGRTVATANGSAVSIANLKAGVYAGIATYAGGKTKSIKFVKK